MSSAVVFVVFLLCLKVVAQGDSLPKIAGIPQGDSLSKTGISQGDSLSKSGGLVQVDSLSKNKPVVQTDSLSKNVGIEDNGLTNIVLTDKKNVRAFGWGEYTVNGRCLCCDNTVDGDCIMVRTTNRTDKIRLKQIVDGNIEADTNDKSTYFGDVYERDRPGVAHVSFLMAEITMNKFWNIYKVIVYTIVDKEKKKSYLSNCCELGYIDQFDRLQWAGKVKANGLDDHITFAIEKSIFTKDVFLKFEGGKNRITEIAIFGKSKTK